MATVPYAQHKNIFATRNGIYLLQNGKTRHIMQMSYVQDALGSSKVSVLNVDSLRHLQSGPSVYSNGSLIASTNRGIHLVVGDKMYYITSMEQFYAYGFKVSNVGNVGDIDIDRQNYAGLLPGSKVKCDGNYFVINNGLKYKVQASEIDVYGGINSFASVECAIIAKNAQTDMKRFVTTPGDKNIYYIDNGAKRHILSWQTFLDLGGRSDGVVSLDSYTFRFFTPGLVI